MMLKAAFDFTDVQPEVIESDHTYSILAEVFNSGTFNTFGTYAGAFPAEIAEIALPMFDRLYDLFGDNTKPIKATAILIRHEGTGNAFRLDAPRPSNQIASMVCALPHFDATSRPRIGMKGAN